MMRNPEQTIGNLIDKQDVAFIGSVDENGFPNMKAMLPPRKRDGIQTFWFTTNTSSLRVAQYRKNRAACIYFMDKRFFRGVMLKGVMHVLEDAESKEMIWQDGDTMYYPGGVTDPDYCVLMFSAISGRYYANFKSEDFDTAGTIIGAMNSHYKTYISDFLYNAIFVPPGMAPPTRDVISMPEISIYIDNLFGQKGDIGVVAERDCFPVGMAWTRIIPAYGHIDDETPELAISVLPEHRGQGIGTQMMEYLFELLREEGYKQTSLSVQTENPAVRFYQRLGYEIIEERSDNAGHADYIMVKKLGE
jgi:general stress protein 26/GNAT superfamily N-acetyltransferase